MNIPLTLTKTKVCQRLHTSLVSFAFSPCTAATDCVKKLHKCIKAISRTMFLSEVPMLSRTPDGSFFKRFLS